MAEIYRVAESWMSIWVRNGPGTRYGRIDVIYGSDNKEYKVSERQNNINITCNTLNDTIVKNGETFSFCNTVGKATSSKGYEEADVFDHNGNKTKGLRRWKLPSK